MAKIDFDIDKYLDQKLIDSMNAQMQPSDEVVSSLLAKIAELEAAELKTVDMPEVEVKPKKRGFSAIPKRVWYYSSAIAASVVILFATFTAIGGSGIDKIKEAFSNIVNIEVVTNEQATKDNNKNIVSTGSNQSSDNKENQTAIVTGTDSEKDNSKQTGKNDSKKDKENKNNKDNNSKGTEPVQDENNQEGNDIDNPENQENQINQENQEGEVKDSTDQNQEGTQENQNVDQQGTLTDPALPVEGEQPVEPPAEEKYEPVETMIIEGNNYIVGSTAKTATLSDESSVSLEVPTNEGAPKKMMVKALKSVSPKLMMAVMPDEGHEEEPVMLYTNADYAPENLAQFIEDADINSASGYGMVGGDGIVIRVKSGVRKNYKAGEKLESSFKENILSQSEAKFMKTSPSSGNVKVIFESTSNSTGIILCFTVTSTGYLNIELQDESRESLNEFTFFVGKEAARQFIFDVTGE